MQLTIAGAEVCRQRRNQKSNDAVARRTFSSENAQNTTFSNHFLKLRCRKKLHAAVARRACSSENAQNTTFSDHFLKLRCRKIARRCGEKDMFK